MLLCSCSHNVLQKVRKEQYHYAPDASEMLYKARNEFVKSVDFNFQKSNDTIFIFESYNTANGAITSSIWTNDTAFQYIKEPNSDIVLLNSPLLPEKVYGYVTHSNYNLINSYKTDSLFGGSIFLITNINPTNKEITIKLFNNLKFTN